jgi:uncharacterized protein (TIGR03435 family)
MRRSLLLLVFAAASTPMLLRGQTPASAQKPVAFDVASVKVNKSGDLEQHIFRSSTGLTATNMPVRQLILFAYQLQSFQLIGGPSWLGSDRFDMTAKIEGDAPLPTLPGAPFGPDAFMVAMRTLLADRFKLTLHREQREMDVYALVLASGPRANLKRSTTDCEAFLQAHRGGLSWPAPGAPVCGLWESPGQIRMGGFPLSLVTKALSALTGRIVFDRTGLSGNWDVTVTYATEQRLQPGGDIAAPDPSAPSIFTALQEQLGLKLESTKGPVDVLVVDRIEKPTSD